MAYPLVISINFQNKTRDNESKIFLPRGLLITITEAILPSTSIVSAPTHLYCVTNLRVNYSKPRPLRVKSGLVRAGFFEARKSAQALSRAQLPLVTYLLPLPWDKAQIWVGSNNRKTGPWIRCKSWWRPFLWNGPLRRMFKNSPRKWGGGGGNHVPKLGKAQIASKSGGPTMLWDGIKKGGAGGHHVMGPSTFQSMGGAAPTPTVAAKGGDCPRAHREGGAQKRPKEILSGKHWKNRQKLNLTGSARRSGGRTWQSEDFSFFFFCFSTFCTRLQGAPGLAKGARALGGAIIGLCTRAR